jgi:hypothetical protein
VKASLEASSVLSINADRYALWIGDFRKYLRWLGLIDFIPIILEGCIKYWQRLGALEATAPA